MDIFYFFQEEWWNSLLQRCSKNFCNKNSQLCVCWIFFC